GGQESLVTGAWRKGNIERAAATCVLAGLPGETASGPECPRILVEADIQHARVPPEDRLRADAVVDVEVDDRHPRESMLSLEVARSDRSVCVEAETHRPI